MIYHCPASVRIRAIQGVLPEFTVKARDQLLAEGIAPSELESYWAAFGFESMHFLLPPDTAADMMIPALREFFAREALSPSSIDTLISVTATPDYALPGNSYRFHQELGLSSSCRCLDINASCTGFINALYTGCSLLASGSNHRVLLVLCECPRLGRGFNFDKPDNLYSDGGAIVLLERDETADAGENEEAGRATSFGFSTLSEFWGHTTVAYSMLWPVQSMLDMRAPRVAPAEQTKIYPNPYKPHFSPVQQQLALTQGVSQAFRCILEHLQEILEAQHLKLSDVACGLLQQFHKMLTARLNATLVTTCRQQAKHDSATGGTALSADAWLDVDESDPLFARYQNFFPFVSTDIGHLACPNIPVTISLHPDKLPHLKDKPLFCCQGDCT